MDRVTDQVDFLITTMDRYELLERLVYSILRYYPKATITIADQSKNQDENFYNKWRVNGLSPKIRKIFLPYDCGLSYARNVLVKNTTKEFKLILEDDFLFTEDTDIEKMRTLAEMFEVVGGRVMRDNVPIPFEHNFMRQDDVLYQVPDGDYYMEYKGIKYKQTECVMNFALFRSVVFYGTIWDKDLKLREHQDFFYRLSQTMNTVAFTPEVKIVDNKPKKQSLEYKALKGRDEFWAVMLKKHGLRKFKYLNGSVVELEDNLIFRSYEPPCNF